MPRYCGPQTGRYVVAFEFDTGAKKFAKITTENTYQRLATSR